MSDYSKKYMIFLTVCFVRKIKDLYTKNYTLTYDSCQETFVRKSIHYLTVFEKFITVRIFQDFERLLPVLSPAKAGGRSDGNKYY